MSKTTRILFLSANPWTTSRILVDEEAREIFEKLQEGSFRDQFVVYNHAAIRPADVQRLLMTYRPHILHFSGHGSKKHKIILGGLPGRGKQIERQALVEVLALYRQHLRLVFLNACFTRNQARSLSAVIDYSVGSKKPIGDKEGVAFAGAFYRALGFGKSVREAFDSAMAELALMNMKRARGLEIFVRDGVSESDRFPHPLSALDKKKAEPFPPATQLLTGGADILESAGALTPSKSVTGTDLEATPLLPPSILGRAAEVISSEQQIFSYQYAKHLFIARRSDTSDPIVSGSSVCTVLTLEHKVSASSQSRAKVRRTRATGGAREGVAKKTGRRHTRRAGAL
jgi:hypothetical protein